ncbi:MAG: DUF4874 domain-containing protein [Lachnospiraceae bacterium]|nr:DUF4874 domain-containing protein [Lachnospiraceae bacterium]MCD7842678.1 DUF4874 domain-containing protein [Lachnospiraceae bacterium]
MKKRSKRIFIILFPAILILAAAAGICLFLYQQRYLPVSWSSESFSETDAVLDNPYRGFYQIHAYSLNEENESLTETLEKHIEENEALSLVLVEINLKEYAESALSDNALAQVDAILSAWAESGQQIILRFLYDWDGNGFSGEPSSLDQVLEHMEQVSEIINHYADSIHILQGVFVGSYGEMNESAYLGNEDLISLITHLAELTDPSIYLAVRTPAQWRTITGLTSLPDSFPASDGSLISRLGLYNDGILGTETDLGTYGNTSRAGSDTPSDKGTRAEELAFQDELCRYVPNGGEVVYDYTLGDLDAAIDTLSQMHISYLNEGYDTTVLEAWKESTYDGDDVFNGCSGYDYISAHLGYRYILTGTGLEFNTWFDGEAIFSFTIQNVGFASSTRDFEAMITLHKIDGSDAETTMLSYTTDPGLCILSSEESTDGTVSIPVRDLSEGTYAAYLTLTDTVTGAKISLASSPEETEYGYPLGTLTIGADWSAVSG